MSIILPKVDELWSDKNGTFLITEVSDITVVVSSLANLML